MRGPIIALMLISSIVTAATVSFAQDAAKAEAELKQLQAEIDRLEALRRVNPSIREEEILLFQRQIDAGLAHIERASLLLQGVRVVVTTWPNVEGLSGPSSLT